MSVGLYQILGVQIGPGLRGEQRTKWPDGARMPTTPQSAGYCLQPTVTTLIKFHASHSRSKRGRIAVIRTTLASFLTEKADHRLARSQFFKDKLFAYPIPMISGNARAGALFVRHAPASDSLWVAEVLRRTQRVVISDKAGASSMLQDQ